MSDIDELRARVHNKAAADGAGAEDTATSKIEELRARVRGTATADPEPTAEVEAEPTTEEVVAELRRRVYDVDSYYRKHYSGSEADAPRFSGDTSKFKEEITLDLTDLGDKPGLVHYMRDSDGVAFLTAVDLIEAGEPLSVESRTELSSMFDSYMVETPEIGRAIEHALTLDTMRATES